MIKPSASLVVRFYVHDATGALANADSLPTGVMLINGSVDVDVTVTVANVSTGIYTASATLDDDYVAGDRVSVQISATVGGLADAATVWHDYVDLQYNKNIAGAAFVEVTDALDQLVDDTTLVASVKASTVEALGTTTWTELAAVPAATATLADMVQFMYMFSRNKLVDNRDTEVQTLYNNAGSILCTAARADDGTSFTRQKYS